MKNFKSIIALFLVCIIITGLFSACGSNSSDTDSTSRNSAVESAQTTSGSDGIKQAETTDATIVLYGESSKRMTEFAKNEFHDKVLKTINVNAKIQYLPWTEYATGKTELMLSSGEKFTTYTDTSFMSKCVSKGYYADLTEAAEKYAGDLKKYCGGDKAFDIWKVNGKLYGLTFGNKPNAGENYLVITRQDLLEEVGMKELKTVEDVEKFYELAKQKHPDYIGSGRGWSMNIFNGAISSDINVYNYGRV